MKKKISSDEMYFANYVTCFLDLLGQADKLLSTPLLLPDLSDEKTKKEFHSSLAHTFLPTRTIQNDFESACGAPNTPIDGLSKQESEVLTNLRKIHIKFQRFSDGHIAYLNLANKDAHTLPYNVLKIVSSACYVMITSLAQGNPIRGGMAIGWGTEFEDSFYGAVIAKAHHLESRIATYPRIVIDNHLIEYLQNIIDDPDDETAFSKGNRNVAALALQYICKDEYDGHWVLDYLGPVFLANFMHDDCIGLIRSAHKFVKQERKKFSATGTVPNEKLAVRYSMLAHYFTNRLTQAGMLR
jgi:hypothetical protein